MQGFPIMRAGAASDFACAFCMIVGAQVPKHPLHFDAAADTLKFGTVDSMP
jgi:hypothetical protein